MHGKKINLWPMNGMNISLWTFLLVILIISLLAVIIWIVIVPINPVEESINESSNIGIALHAKEKPKLTFRYKKWLEEDVSYIISDLEKEVFTKLKTDRDRDLFMKSFWKYRDPTPDTPENEFREEHFLRINYANRMFSKESYCLGWKTDRGKYYIILGPPKAVTKFTRDQNNYEMWYYDGTSYKKLYPAFNLFFVQYSATGEYVLVHVSKGEIKVSKGRVIGN